MTGTCRFIDGTVAILAGTRDVAGDVIETNLVQIWLSPPADLALWRDAQDQWHGVLQDCAGPLPSPLATLTTNWLRLARPKPLETR